MNLILNVPNNTFTRQQTSETTQQSFRYIRLPSPQVQSPLAIPKLVGIKDYAVVISAWPALGSELSHLIFSVSVAYHLGGLFQGQVVVRYFSQKCRNCRVKNLVLNRGWNFKIILYCIQLSKHLYVHHNSIHLKGTMTIDASNAFASRK